MSDVPSRAVVLVTGLSGGGKASVLRALEDVGYEAVDNPPLPMLDDMVARGERKLAVGVDARTRGFDAAAVLDAVARLRQNHQLRVNLVYAWADQDTLLRRYTESRRRHPLAPQGRVTDGINAELALTDGLRQQADLVIDTSDLPITQLRRVIERHFGSGIADDQPRMAVSLLSFAYPKGLPREADLVFDARFLRNPYYDPILKSKTGLDPEVGAYIEKDSDFAKFFDAITSMVELLLPRFVQEGKKYATITIGCTGGQHRSVHLIEKLANHLTLLTTARQCDTDPGNGGSIPWRVFVTHRELARNATTEAFLMDRPVASRDDSVLDNSARVLTVQA